MLSSFKQAMCKLPVVANGMAGLYRTPSFVGGSFNLRSVSIIRVLCTASSVPKKPATEKTIFAQATPMGRAAVAIIRVSGPETGDIIRSMLHLKEMPKPFSCIYRSIWHPTTEGVIDKAIILWFPGPNSYTGEDSCEFHTHGGHAVHVAMYDALRTFKNVRLAMEGEFTRRAFYNGKLDVTEVEGIAELLDAETESQRKQAIAQAAGGMRTAYEAWIQELTLIGAILGADMEFGSQDELNVDKVDVRWRAESVLWSMKKFLGDPASCVERVRSGVKIVIIGQPNVGKSSLMNQISKRKVSIVSAVPGTTRDVIHAPLNLAGFAVNFADTAGLDGFRNMRRGRAHFDEIEHEAMERTRSNILDADLLVYVAECETAVRYMSQEKTTRNDGSIGAYKRSYLAHMRKLTRFLKKPTNKGYCPVPAEMVIFNKADKMDVHLFKRFEKEIVMSALTGQGVEDFMERLVVEVDKLCGGMKLPFPRICNANHRKDIEKSVEYLVQFLWETSGDCAIRADLITRALNQLANLNGRNQPTDVLELIFKRFCIGK